MTSEILERRDENDKAVLEFIEKMEYPKIYIGKITDRQMNRVDWRILKKGKMTPEEKELFDYANKILQFPSSIYRTLTIRRTSRNNYSYAISRYLKYSAQKKITPAEFTVEGIFMTECMRQYIDERAEAGHTGDSSKTIEGFQHGLAFFNYCIALYKCRNINDAVVKAQRVKELRIIPNLQYLIDFCQERRQLHYEIARDNFHNKHTDEYTNETYTTENLKAMMINMYNLTGQGDGKKKEIYYGINAVLEILLGHHLLYRGENKRSLEISDITFRDYDSACGLVPILGFTTNQSSTHNGNGKPHSMGACRNKDVEICLVTAISMSFWYRFDFEGDHGNLAGENRPNFLDKRSWYPVKVLFADSANSRNNESISYKHEAFLVKMCLKSISVVLTKTTHIRRQVGARRADANQVELSQINRAGNRKQSILEGSYLTSYPFEFIFFSGGFAPEEPYDCLRDIEPPESLQIKIFPWLDAAIKKVEARDNATEWVGNNTRDVEKDTAAAKFLQMLKTFRKVILQDLTHLVERAPESIFAKHPITKDPEFIRFKERVFRVQEDLGFSESMQEKRSVVNILAPSFVKKLDSVKFAMNKMYTAMIKGFEETQNKQEESTLSSMEKRDGKILQEVQAAVNDKLWEIINDRYQNDGAREYYAESKIEILAKQNAEKHEELTKSIEEFKESQSKILNNILANQKVLIESMQKNTHLSSVVCDRVVGPIAKYIDPSIVDDAMAIHGHVPMTIEGTSSSLNQVGNDSTEQAGQASGTGVTDLSIAFPNLKMRPDSDTVMKLMDEWYVSKPGLPSVVTKNRVYGKNWRLASSIYKRRKAIINYMEQHLNKSDAFPNITGPQLGQLIDDYRERNDLQMNGLSTRFQSQRYKDEITQELGQIWAHMNSNQ